MADDFRFARRHRLTRGSDLERVARTGKRLRCLFLEARLTLSRRDYSRIGFVVARFGQSAVRRNQLKRVLREHTRRHLLGTLRAMKPGETVDVVLRTGPDAYGASAAALESDIAKLNVRIPTLFTERDLPQGELPGRARPSDP